MNLNSWSNRWKIITIITKVILTGVTLREVLSKPNKEKTHLLATFCKLIYNFVSLYMSNNNQLVELLSNEMRNHLAH